MFKFILFSIISLTIFISGAIKTTKYSHKMHTTDETKKFLRATNLYMFGSILIGYILGNIVANL